MKFNGHKILITLITAMVVLVAMFMASEPQNKSRGGQRYITEKILSGVLTEIKPGMPPGKYSKDGIEYEILNYMSTEDVLNACQKQIDSYYDADEDSYVYFRKIDGSGDNKNVYARIVIKRDFKIYLYSFINSKKSIVFLTILLLAFISLYFIFSSYNSSIKAEVESQKYNSLQKLSRGLAHEIRNPLNAMHLSLQLISDGGFFENGASGVKKAESDKELKECLDIIREEIKRLDETVTRFMQYSKDIKLNRESTDINKLIQRAINIMTPVFEQKKARVVFNAAGANENLNCSIDGVLFYQVILNIVKNSAEAVFENGNVSAVSYRERDKINIKIANDGPEIAQENLSKIFDFYFTTKIEGSGIGLALSKKIIEAHGGDISVKSDKNETCFLISIPCRAE